MVVEERIIEFPYTFTPCVLSFHRYGLTDMGTQIIIIRAHAYVSVKIEMGLQIWAQIWARILAQIWDSVFMGMSFYCSARFIQIWAQGLPYGNLNAISIIIP